MMAFETWGQPFMSPATPSQPSAVPAHLQVVEYEKTLQGLDPTAPAEKQAKIALDAAIAAGSLEQLQVVMAQIEQRLPQELPTLMMHALRATAVQDNLVIMQFLLEKITTCPPQQIFEFLKYALDGAATRESPGSMDLDGCGSRSHSMMEFLLGGAQKVFQTSYPEQFLQLVQHAVNAAARRGNLGLLKFLMDHTAAASLPISYDDVFGNAVASGQAESLLQEAIKGGASFEGVILMLLQSIKNLPHNGESGVGSRQSLKNTAKVQLVRSYKQRDPALFAKLMAAVKTFFPEDLSQASPGGFDGDVSM